MPQGAEWLVILAIVVLVFGAAKLPDLARGTGQALRIFKTETKGLATTTTTTRRPSSPRSSCRPQRGQARRRATGHTARASGADGPRADKHPG